MTVEKTMSDQRAKELQIVECCREWVANCELMQANGMDSSRSSGLDAFGCILRKDENMDRQTKEAGLAACVECGMLTQEEADEIL